MNAGQSIQIALIKKGMKKKELAAEIGITPNYLSDLLKKESCSGSMMERLAAAFEMEVSEFIALAE